MLEVSFTGFADALKELLRLDSPAIAISFSHNAPEGISEFPGEPPEAAEGGRTGKVAAGCVFWSKASEKTFTTRPDDHANCNVGSFTHGLKSLEEASKGSDVATILEVGWVRAEDVPGIPHVSEKFSSITYGPLSEAKSVPDVVFLHLNPKQTMILSDAIPEMLFEGKPQCHIIAIAKESNKIAASVGCMLSRVRTGMRNSEMTCAIPGSRLEEVVERLTSAIAVDKKVAAYASEDAKRFH